MQHTPETQYSVLIAWSTHRGPLPAFTASFGAMMAHIAKYPIVPPERRIHPIAKETEHRTGGADRRQKNTRKPDDKRPERRQRGGVIVKTISMHLVSTYHYLFCQNAAQRALEGGFTHLMVLDDDMDFPPDALHRLLAWKQPVVTVNYCMRTWPPFPVMKDFAKEGDPPLYQAGGRPFFIADDETGLRPFYRAGMGVFLCETEVFTRIGEKPWFPMHWMKGHVEEYEGNDYAFYRKCMEAGIPLYCDTWLSRQIGHNGYQRYTLDMISEEFRRPYEALYHASKKSPLEIAGDLLDGYEPGKTDKAQLASEIIQAAEIAKKIKTR